MLQIFDSTRVVSVKAESRGSNTKYSITVEGRGEIHSSINPKPASYNDMLAYYLGAVNTLKTVLDEMELDATTIAQEVKISIMVQAA